MRTCQAKMTPTSARSTDERHRQWFRLPTPRRILSKHPAMALSCKIGFHKSSRRNRREKVIYCRSMGMIHCFGAGYPKMLYVIGNIAHKIIAASIVAIGILKRMLCVMKACCSPNVLYICLSAPVIHGQHTHIHMFTWTNAIISAQCYTNVVRWHFASAKVIGRSNGFFVRRTNEL